MQSEHVNFLFDLCGRVGAPIFSATLVACLLSRRFELAHGVLLGVGFALIILEHWRVHHHRGRSE